MEESAGIYVSDGKWTDHDTEQLIKWRMGHHFLFSGKKSSARNGWERFIRETLSTLDGDWTAAKAKKKWSNLKRKYQEIRSLGTDVETVNPNSWQWFHLMEKAVERESTASEALQLTSSVGDDDNVCTPQPCKRVCQMQVGGDILELLTTSMIEVKGGSEPVLGDERVTAETATQNKQADAKDPETDHFSVDLDAEKASLKRERWLVEKEHAEVDRERVILEKERDLAERENVALQRERVRLEKDRAALDRDRAALEQERARIEKDRAVLERDRAALQREKDRFTAMVLGRNDTGQIDMDTGLMEDRKRLIFLFERLIERF
ncbi:microtubule-associated protein 1A isoform X1 [Pygocentrus nattereri]|uniref:Myb/SANT-like DNA-binding domain-containing protein n=1 Tax=Pygocentrus nattereri TaxID=42514 RepID=A0A3B4CVX6_PYGNA|nr:microtubule-associated protein 1A isoform X1 [Pygocentrus nattereri]